MDSGTVTCLSTFMILFSALMMYLSRRTVENKLREQQVRALVAMKRDVAKQHDAMLVVLKWVHQVHQAVYFAEVCAQRRLPEQPDNSGWEEVTGKLEALGPCPAESGLLPESLRSMLASIEPQLAEIKGCVVRHRESLVVIPYGTPAVAALSAQELGAARKALAADLEEKARKFNLFMETLEKHFDAAFFGTTEIKLHKGRYD